MASNALVSDIVVQNPSRYQALETAALRDWTVRFVSEVAPGTVSFTLRLVGDEEMRRLNRQYRGRDSTTDVLSFPGEVSEEGAHLGDVVISVPTARSQAKDRGHSTQKELRLLLVHGVLHCLGHDHETDAGEMDRIETRLRRRWLADVD